MKTSQEKWKQIYLDNKPSNYWISNKGRVWTNKKKTFMKPQRTTDGYLFVHFPYKNKAKRIYLRINRLVAIYFIPNPDNKPEVNHINGDKEDNTVENLEWSTRSENMTHCFRTGLHPSTRGENSHVATHTEKDILYIAKLLEDPSLSLSDICKITGESKSFVHAIVSRSNWWWLTAGFKFADRSSGHLNKKFYKYIDELILHGYTNKEIFDRLSTTTLNLTYEAVRGLIRRRVDKLKKEKAFIKRPTTKRIDAILSINIVNPRDIK